MLTSLLVESIKAENDAAGRRPKAFDTFTRHSAAGKCTRQIQLGHLDYPETNPMDLAGHWVTWVGRMVHEAFQEALLNHYPEAQVEYKVRIGDLSSGHLDAYLVIELDHVTICYELKTRGSYGFDRATGLMRKGWNMKNPEGPNIADIAQGSLNALASGADVLIIGIIGLESISKGYADKFGLDDLRRIMAEWHYSRSEWEPIAVAEVARLEEIRAWTERETLAPRWGLDDHGYQVVLNPAKGEFPCSYCAYKDLCEWVGEGPVPLPIPGMRQWMNNDLAGLLEESVNAL
jgi:hypothetical protein